MESETVYISETEVSANLRYSEVIGNLEKAFHYLGEGKAQAPPRMRVTGPKSILNVMPAAIESMGLSGLKFYHAGKEGGRFMVALFPTQEKGKVFLVEAGILGQIRTGALAALASSLLVKERNISLGVVGTGFQAESQVLAHASIFKLSRVKAYSRKEENRKKFQEKMREHGIEVFPVTTIKDLMAGSRVICTVTNSTDPVIHLEDLPSVYHINLVGANLPWRREASPEVLKDCELVVVEHLEQAMTESSEITDYVNSGFRPVELKDLNHNMGLKRTIFKSMGNGIEDIAAGYTLLKSMKLI